MSTDSKGMVDAQLCKLRRLASLRSLVTCGTEGLSDIQRRWAREGRGSSLIFGPLIIVLSHPQFSQTLRSEMQGVQSYCASAVSVLGALTAIRHARIREGVAATDDAPSSPHWTEDSEPRRTVRPSQPTGNEARVLLSERPSGTNCSWIRHATEEQEGKQSKSVGVRLHEQTLANMVSNRAILPCVRDCHAVDMWWLRRKHRQACVCPRRPSSRFIGFRKSASVRWYVPPTEPCSASSMESTSPPTLGTITYCAGCHHSRCGSWYVLAT